MKTVKARYEGDQALRLVPGGVVRPGDEVEAPADKWPVYRRLGFVKVAPRRKKQEDKDAGTER